MTTGLTDLSYLSELCGYDYPDHFREWENLILAHRRLLLVASRDHGKSTFISKLYPLARAIRQPGIEILVISYSETQVMRLVVGIADLFEDTPGIKTLVPGVREEDWSKTALKLKNGSRIDSLTFGTSGRGGHYDLIIVDDPVKDFGGMDPDDQEDYFLRAVVPMCKPDGAIVVTGTFVYENDLIERLQKNKAYHCAEYPAIKANGAALWPERWPLPLLATRRLEVGEYGFAREYMLERLSPGTQFFKRAMFRHYDPDKLPERLSRVLSLDPAISVDGDDTAMMLTGTSADNKTYLLDYSKMRTDDVQAIIDEIFRLVKLHDVPYIQIETIGFQRMLKHWIYEAMREHDLHFGIEEIKSYKMTKEARIMSLQPRIAAGSLLFHPADQEDVIKQFLAFPRGLRDDMIDALSMQVGRWDKPHPATEKAPQNSWDWWKEKATESESHGWHKELTG